MRGNFAGLVSPQEASTCTTPDLHVSQFDLRLFGCRVDEKVEIAHQPAKASARNSETIADRLVVRGYSRYLPRL
jgi:hypothetical protein